MPPPAPLPAPSEHLPKSPDWAHFDQLTATLPDSIYLYTLVHDPNGDQYFTYLSPNASLIHELGLKEMLREPKTIFSQNHPDDQARYVEAAQASLEKLSQFDQQWRIITPSGKIKWLHGSSKPQAQSDGRTIWHGMVQEVSAWKRTEEELRTAEHNLEEAQRIAHVGSWKLTHQTQAMEWSAETCRIFEQDLSGCAIQCQASLEKFYAFVHPLDRAYLEVLFDQHLQTQAPVTTEHRLQFPDGKIKYVKQQWETEFTPEGRPLTTQGVIQDITEKHASDVAQTRAAAQIQALNQELERRIEARTAELSQREAYFRGILEAALDPILIANLEGNISHTNPAAVNLFGYSEAELLQLNAINLHPASEIPRVVESFEEIRSQGKSRVLDLKIQTKTGEIIPVDVAASLLELEAETVIIGMFRDLRERQSAAAALAQSEAKYQQIFETAAEGVWILDQDACTVLANEALVRLLGTNIAAMTRTPAFGWFSPASQIQLQTNWQRRRAGFSDQYETQLQRADGTVIDVAISASPIIGPAGEFQGSLAMVTDISQRKVAEQETQLLRQRLEFLITTSPAATYSCQTAGNFDMNFISDNCRRIFGYQPCQLTENSGFWLSCIHPEDQDSVLQAHNHQLQEQGWLKVEYRFRHQQGHYIWLQDEMRLVRDESNQAMEVVGFLADITDRKNAETELERLAYHLTNAQRIAKVGSWEFDVVTQAITWSEEVFRIFGYDPADPAPTYAEFLELLHPEDREFFQGTVQATINSGTPYEMELPFDRLDGREGYFFARGEVLRNPQGRVAKLIGTVLDIRERKTTELAKQKVIQELTAIKWALDQVATLVITDTDGTIVDLNERMCQRTGYSRDELIGQNPRLLKSGLHPQSFYGDLYRTLGQGQVWQGEICNKNKFGELYWEQASIVPLFDQEHRISQYLAIRFDISQRKRAELAANERAVELDRFFSLSVDLIIIAGLDGRIQRINQQWQATLGHSLEDMVDRQFIDFVHPDDVEATHQATAQLLQGLTVMDFTNRYRTQEGSYRWLEWRAIGLDGQIFAVARDVTQAREIAAVTRKQAKQERLLREITQRIRDSLDLQTIFETACAETRQILKADRVGVFRFDPETGCDDGVFVAESLGAGFISALDIRIHDHCFGEKYAPLYAQGRYAIMPDVYALEDDCHTDVLAQIQVRANLVIPLTCGDVLWGLLCVHQCSGPRQWQTEEAELAQTIANQLAIAIQQANLFTQLQQELQQRQATEQQLLQSNQELAIINQELERATRLKDEFLANMSHELRTPLNAILGLSEGLEEQVFGPLNDAQLRAIKTVEGSGTHLLDLINDILDVAKIESGQLELDLEPTALGPLCQSTLVFVKQQAIKKNIKLMTNIPENLPCLEVDERRLRQALINLLSNAVKFTPEGGQVSLEVTVHPAEVNLDTQAFVRLSVRDTGIGIAPENLDRLFKPFIQIDSALNRKYAGTGLGLALVKRVVELHGGQVGVASEVGQGSCFYFDLSYDPTTCVIESKQPSAPLTNPKDTLPPSQSPLILLAEDNEANIQTLSNYLVSKGYQIVVARDGVKALSMAADIQPDLILMDVQMPEMDGLEAIQHLREMPHFQQTPIIALTALAMPGDRDRCLSAGANDYLSKPIRLKTLTSKIQELLSV